MSGAEATVFHHYTCEALYGGPCDCGALARKAEAVDAMRRDLQARNTELVLANRGLRAVLEALVDNLGCGCCATEKTDAAIDEACRLLGRAT